MSRGKEMNGRFQDVGSGMTDTMLAMLRLDTFFNVPDYTGADKRKSLVETAFEQTRKAFESAGREGTQKDIDRRKRAIIKSFDRVIDAFKSLDLRSVEESFVSFEAICLYDYDMIDDADNCSLAAALWVLEDLRRTGKLHDAYRFLPKSMMQMEDVYIPIDFYHPCYDQDLIRSVAHVISTRNSRTKTAGEFRAVMNLVDADRIKTAIEHFKELQWQALTCFMKAEEYFDRKTEAVMRELKNMMNPSVLVVNNPQNNEERKREAVIKESLMEHDRWKFQERFETYLETGESRINGSRELGRIMKEFRIDDPFEVCFALIYLRGMDDDAVWLMKVGVSVTTAACRLLPWHYDISEASEEEFDSWFEGMTYGRENGWLEEKTSDGIDYFHSNKPGEPNPAQQIYRLCRGVVPFGMHPFNHERQQMKEEGIENADLIADWADILFLQSFHAFAANLRRADWFDWDEDEDETEGISVADKVADAAQETNKLPLKLGGYWGKVAAGQGRKIDTPVANDDAQSSLKQNISERRALTEELEKAKREIKSLRKSLSILQHDTDAELAKVEHELKNLRMEHRELADLRELVFNRESDDPAQLEKAKKQIEYPYETKKRTVIFGGHETFLKAIKPMLPTAKFVDVSNYAFNPEIIRNADVVWIQNNCISHSQFWSIVKICKIAGVQMRYFAYASAAKCAEQLVTEDQKIY